MGDEGAAKPSPPRRHFVLNPRALRANFERRLTLIFQRVAAGLNHADEVGRLDMHIPGAAHQLRWSRGKAPTDAQVREDFSAWIVRAGFREACDTVAYFLDELHEFLLHVELSNHSIIDQAILAPMRKRHRDFQHKGPEEKFKSLRAQGVMALEPPVEESVVSLYYARNCFVHRLGRVGGKDMRGGNPLVVSWARTKTVVVGPDGTRRDMIPGTIVRREDRGQIELETVRREFTLGETVTFTPAEFSEMMFGLVSFFILPVMGAVVDALKAAGLVTPEGDVVKPTS